MNNKRISEQLQFEIKEYLVYYWQEKLNRDPEKENNIINQLNDSLKITLLKESNKMILKDSQLFRNRFSEETINKTIPLIKGFK